MCCFQLSRLERYRSTTASGWPWICCGRDWKRHRGNGQPSCNFSIFQIRASSLLFCRCPWDSNLCYVSSRLCHRRWTSVALNVEETLISRCEGFIRWFLLCLGWGFPCYTLCSQRAVKVKVVKGGRTWREFEAILPPAGKWKKQGLVHHVHPCTSSLEAHSTLKPWSVLFPNLELNIMNNKPGWKMEGLQKKS